MAIKLKPEYQNTIIGFRNNSIILGHRSQVDLDWLYAKAKNTNNKAHLDMFEGEPDEAAATKAFNDKQAAKQTSTPGPIQDEKKQ